MWLLGAQVFLTLFGIDTVIHSLSVNWINRDLTSTIQSCGLSYICAVCDINKTGTIKRMMSACNVSTCYVTSKLSTKLKTSKLLGCWLNILSGGGFYLWTLVTLVFLTLFCTDTFENVWGLCLIPRELMGNIQFFFFSSIYLICNIIKTRKRQRKSDISMLDPLARSLPS